LRCCFWGGGGHRTGDVIAIKLKKQKKASKERLISRGSTKKTEMEKRRGISDED